MNTAQSQAAHPYTTPHFGLQGGGLATLGWYPPGAFLEIRNSRICDNQATQVSRSIYTPHVRIQRPTPAEGVGMLSSVYIRVVD